MKTLPVLTITALLALSQVATADKKPAGEKQKSEKTTEVKLGGMVLQVPESWKAAKSSSSMRLATYEIPAAEGDASAGELSIFSFGGGGGGVSANLERWIGQFESTGRESKVVQGKSSQGDYFLADISGTYKKPDGPPFQRKTIAAPNYRMLGLILVVNLDGDAAQKVFFLKLTGPDKTIKAQATAFRTAFGGDPKTEKNFEL